MRRRALDLQLETLGTPKALIPVLLLFSHGALTEPSLPPLLGKSDGDTCE